MADCSGSSVRYEVILPHRPVKWVGYIPPSARVGYHSQITEKLCGHVLH